MISLGLFTLLTLSSTPEPIVLSVELTVGVEERIANTFVLQLAAALREHTERPVELRPTSGATTATDHLRLSLVGAARRLRISAARMTGQGLTTAAREVQLEMVDALLARELAVALYPTPTSGPDLGLHEAAPPRSTSTWVWVGLATGVGLAGTGLGLGIAGSSLRSAIVAGREPEGLSGQAIGLSTAGNVLITAAIVTTSAALLWWFIE